ncbi:MAG: insulinase family protein, partial [Lachnospiraceae bacterium]|nr:insulinase family protein [Lachnospiraceae bacterium]
MVCALLAGCGRSTPSGRSSSAASSKSTPTVTLPAPRDTSTTEATQEATAEEEPAEDGPQFAGFPETGTTVEGFTLIETRPMPIMGAEIGWFSHEASGAKLMYIHNDDPDRAFDLTFLTHSIDNTGLPHVFEHATLSGSEKYPSKNLTFNLMYQTYTTFMNAMTADRMTSYPISSLSEAQLLALADFYTDSCFYPLIMEDESIYREEAWRYRLADAEAPLSIEGTVYSEMLGAMTKSRWGYLNAVRESLPGSSICFESGGLPSAIPDMEWQDLKDYHDRFYRPENCVAFLYGNIVEYEKFLALLDGVFSAFETPDATAEADAADS